MASIISAGTTSGTSLNLSADTSGQLELKTGSGPTTAITISSAQLTTIANDATISGLTVGKGGGAVSSNTAIGVNALTANEAGGTNNTAIGNAALDENTTGDANTAIGKDTLTANTTASNNTAVGYVSLRGNTTGANNTSVGMNSMADNTTGSTNTALGYRSLISNTTASNNTAIGTDALLSNTTASNNTAVGHEAGYSNTTGTANSFFGLAAGYTATTANYNTLVGRSAGFSLTTGSKNTFVGAFDPLTGGSGGGMTTGSNNTILGPFNGNQGGLDIRTSSNNIVLSDGDGNVPLVCVGVDNAVWRLNGKAAGNYAGILQFCVDHALKSEIYHNDVDDRLTIQNDSGGVYLASGGTSWTSNSDERFKNITGEIQNGLSKVCTLRAAEYTWKADESEKPQVGLIAQDVLAVLPEAVQIPQEGSTNRDGSPAMMGISYTETIPLLVAAIKELKATVDAQAARIAALEGAQ